MKKTIRLIMTVLSVTVFVASCQKPEFEEQVRLPKVDLEISALAETTTASETPVPQNAPSTKMSLGQDLKPQWHATDEIAIFDGSEVNKFVIKAAEGNVATFNGQVTVGSNEFWALYPYQEGLSYNTSVGYRTSILAEQRVAKGDSVDTGALMAMAHAKRNAEGVVQFAFKNVCGLIEVTIPESGKISSVVISSNGEEKFAGEGTVKLDENGLPVFTPGANAVGSVTLLPEGETFDKGNYYAVVAPVKFETGFSISLVRTDGAAGVKSTDKVMEVVRNGGTNLKDIVAVSDWSIKIYTKEQLFAWAANYGKKDHVTLMADIDMNNEPWTPIGISGSAFSGIFDGNNHKLYNYHVSRDGHCGLFHNLSGTVKNLVIGSKDGATYDGSSIVESAHVSSTAWGHVGSVTSFLATGGKIENVKNFAKIFIKNQNKPKCCFGGLVGSSDGSNNEIKNCENHGEIVHEAADGQITGASNHQCGGIIGKTDGKIIIDGCKNYGTITISGDKVDIVGGIIGNPNGANKANLSDDIKNCYNYGAINVTKTTSSVNPMALGGIVGKLTGATLTNCHNHGTISSVCDVLTGIGGIAGIHKLEHESKISGCSNGVQNDAAKGILTFNPATATNQMVLGGILGYSEDYKGKLTLENCSNYAPISSSHNAMRNIGGVVGAIGKVTAQNGEKSTIELLIDKCHNYGAITIGGSASISGWQRHIGGIAGMLYGPETEAGLTVSGCTNNATISTTATGGGEHRIAGIAGHIQYGKISISGCTNNGEVKATGTAMNPRPAGIVSVVNAGTSLSISNCCNKAKLTNTSSTGTLFAGGIVAYSYGTNISGCQNEGAIEVTNCGGGAKIGGIVGADNKTASTISTCVNKGQILYSHTQQPWIGGILGYAGVPSKISGCTNEMANTDWTYSVWCKSTNKVMVGGILGFNDGKAVEVTGCTNNGIIIGENSASCANYISVGGICGRINNGSAKVNDNTCGTLSHVKLIANTTNQLAVAGGIIGGANTVGEISGNVNNGKVTATNAATANSNCAYAGGIFGSDCESGSGAASVTGNKNFGAIHAAVTGKAAADNSYFTGTGTGIGAGGLFGGISKTAAANVKDDNINYGNVTATNFGTESGAGALAGASKNTWSAKVGSSVTVNGAAGAEGTPASAWLCPVGGGTVTATYVDAPAN